MTCRTRTEYVYRYGVEDDRLEDLLNELARSGWGEFDLEQDSEGDEAAGIPRTWRVLGTRERCACTPLAWVDCTITTTEVQT